MTVCTCETYGHCVPCSDARSDGAVMVFVSPEGAETIRSLREEVERQIIARHECPRCPGTLNYHPATRGLRCSSCGSIFEEVTT